MYDEHDQIFLCLQRRNINFFFDTDSNVTSPTNTFLTVMYWSRKICIVLADFQYTLDVLNLSEFAEVHS